MYIGMYVYIYIYIYIYIVYFSEIKKRQNKKLCVQVFRNVLLTELIKK